MRYDLYLPATADTLGIDSASAIVGKTLPDGRLHLFFEGNRFAAQNLMRYAERARSAAGRLHKSYPTIAQAIVPASAVVRIGSYDVTEWVIAELDEGAHDQLQDWLKGEALPAAIQPDNIRYGFVRPFLNPDQQLEPAWWDGQAWTRARTPVNPMTRAEADAAHAQSEDVRAAQRVRFTASDDGALDYLPD